MESKASRETIMRLVSEVTNEQKKAAGCYQDIEKLSKVHNCMMCMFGSQMFPQNFKLIFSKGCMRKKASERLLVIRVFPKKDTFQRLFSTFLKLQNIWRLSNDIV